MRACFRDWSVKFSGAVLALVSLCAAGASADQTPIRFSLDGPFQGAAAPFLVAIDRGYYRAQNLEVTVDSAATMLEPVERVASGTYDMALADINAVIKYRDQHPADAPHAICMVYNKPAFAIVARKSRGITQPKDLEGKKLGAPPGDNSFAVWKIFTQANDIDAGKVAVTPIGAAVREPMLAAGQLDAITGLSFMSYINLKDRGVPPDDLVLMLMADHGLALYGQAIIVNSKFAADHPDAVRSFLRAYICAIRDTIREPNVAVEAVLRRNEMANKEVELNRLRMALKDNMLTPEVKANEFGSVDAERLAKSIEQLAQSYSFKTKPGPSDVFDASFLPPIAERKIN
jgi:NitT/TauT family transport system substrate-binding protein